MTTTNTIKHDRFRRGSGCFKCVVCQRMTRDTGQGVDHLCEDCYELAGIDNTVNDNGLKAGDKDFEMYRHEVIRRLAKIAAKGGNVAKVKGANGFLFPAMEIEPAKVNNATQKYDRKQLRRAKRQLVKAKARVAALEAQIAELEKTVH